MKIKERALSLLLSLVMVLTFMPALAFAEAEEGADADGVPVVEESASVEEETLKEQPAEEHAVGDVKSEFAEAPEETLKTDVRNENEPDIYVDYEATVELVLSDDRTLAWDAENHSFNIQEGDAIKVSYNDTEVLLDYVGLDEDGDPSFSENAGTGAGWLYFSPETQDALVHVWDQIEDGHYLYNVFDNIPVEIVSSVSSISFSPSIINVWGPSITEADETGSYYNIWKRYRWNYSDGSFSDYEYAPGDTLTVKYTDGTVASYVCKEVDNDAWFTDGEKKVWPDGLFYENNLVPGNNAATISFAGATCSVTIFIDTPELAAQRAAAAAEAARQGTYDPSLPKVKASKPKASKKAFTAKWKKLKKKQLKSGVTNIEVWACADGAFANGSTIERVVGKKKASLKIKGMQKGVTYFVKVRAVKYVGGVKYVGPWSAVKKVKVKK